MVPDWDMAAITNGDPSSLAVLVSGRPARQPAPRAKCEGERDGHHKEEIGDSRVQAPAHARGDPQRPAHALLRGAAWLRDLAASINHSVDRLAERLLDALAPTLTTADGVLRTTAPHRPSPVAVPWHLTEPHRWPALPSQPARRPA